MHNFAFNNPLQKGNEKRELRLYNKMRIMNRNTFWSILLLLLIIGCTNEVVSTKYNALTVQGGEINGFNSPSRSEFSETLPAGSQLTFYSQGGIHADELLLSYNGNTWEGESSLEWEDTQESADGTCFCPPLYRNHPSFYLDGILSDQLYAQVTAQHGENIHLSFQHLFARVVFDVSSKLNRQISQIEFTPSLSVVSVIPESGEVICQETANSLFMERNEQGKYAFLVPPDTLSISIRIHTATGQCYERRLETYPFSSGHEYSCAIKLTGEEIGISTVEDFIAFTHLINGEAYGERSLEEFGEKTGKNMTYYLLNDLTFTEEESAQVQMIGKYGSSTSSEKRLFNDIFDGNEHSLTNLQLNTPVGGYYYFGLFSGLSATGVVKNLIIDQAVYNNPDNTDRASFLVGLNRGEINHCMLRNSTIKDIDPFSGFGGLTYQNEGSIINCHIDEVYLSSELQYGNIVTRNNQKGRIINCAVTNCNLNKAQYPSGFICATSKNGEIQNCYLKGNAGEKNYAICLQATDTEIRCCYYDTGTKAPIGNDYVVAPSDSIMKYGNLLSITENNLYQILNQWVRDSGARLFPDFSFLLWEKGETLPAILVSP